MVHWNLPMSTKFAYGWPSAVWSSSVPRVASLPLTHPRMDAQHCLLDVFGGPEVAVCTLTEQNLWPDLGRNKRLVSQRSKLQKSPEDDKIRWDVAHRNRLFLRSTNWLHSSAILMEPDTNCSKMGPWPLGSQLAATVSSPVWNVPFLSSYCWLMPMTYFSFKSHIITLKAFWCPHNK